MSTPNKIQYKGATYVKAIDQGGMDPYGLPGKQEYESEAAALKSFVQWLVKNGRFTDVLAGAAEGSNALQGMMPIDRLVELWQGETAMDTGTNPRMFSQAVATIFLAAWEKAFLSITNELGLDIDQRGNAL